jgi:UDP-N-acetylglucosamine 2-epimerase (non-hydrolysing)
MNAEKAGMINVLFVFGTRPEAIKLATVVKRLRMNDAFRVTVCVTAQHREMLDPVLEFFDIRPDVDLHIMKVDQDLFDITTRAMNGIREVILSFRPDWLIVQGDTTSTFAGALAAFYERVKVAHIEAGLRSFNRHSPFPEETNRVLTTHLTDLHFAPTETARNNLLNEGIPEDRIFVVGNTSIDALFFCLKLAERKNRNDFASLKAVNFDKRIVLVTGHRRESFGKPFENICQALKVIALEKDVEIVFPLHLNPNVRMPVFNILKGVPNIHLIEPLDYLAFVWLLKMSYVILSDSGGVQEEAPSLGKPVLVMRDVTERVEGIEAGTAVLVGTDKDRIVHETLKLLNIRTEYDRMSGAVNPYGDGMASKRIESILLKLSGEIR